MSKSRVQPEQNVQNGPPFLKPLKLFKLPSVSVVEKERSETKIRNYPQF